MGLTSVLELNNFHIWVAAKTCDLFTATGKNKLELSTAFASDVTTVPDLSSNRFYILLFRQNGPINNVDQYYNSNCAPLRPANRSVFTHLLDFGYYFGYCNVL